jgi:hypothetical protein
MYHNNSDAFGRKRLATHLLVLLGALLALPLYALLLAEGNGKGVCHGLLALHRCQILCALAALALVLRCEGEWVDVLFRFMRACLHKCITTQ